MEEVIIDAEERMTKALDHLRVTSSPGTPLPFEHRPRSTGCGNYPAALWWHRKSVFHH